MNTTNLTLFTLDRGTDFRQGCIDWCKSELERYVISADYSGFILIVISVVTLLIYMSPYEFKQPKLNELREILVHFAILLQIGFLIMRVLIQ